MDQPLDDNGAVGEVVSEADVQDVVVVSSRHLLVVDRVETHELGGVRKRLVSNNTSPVADSSIPWRGARVGFVARAIKPA